MQRKQGVGTKWPIKEMKFRIAFIVIALCRLTGENPTVCITNVMKRIASYWNEEIKSRGYEDIPLDLSPFRGGILKKDEFPGYDLDSFYPFYDTPLVDGFDGYSLIYAASDLSNIRPCPSKYFGPDLLHWSSINIPDPWDEDLPAGMVQGVIASAIQAIARKIGSELPYKLPDESSRKQEVQEKLLKGKADLAFLGYLIAHYSKTESLGREIASEEIQRICNEAVDLVGYSLLEEIHRLEELHREYEKIRREYVTNNEAVDLALIGYNDEISRRQEVWEKLVKGKIDLAFLLNYMRYLIGESSSNEPSENIQRIYNEVVALGICSPEKEISSEEIQRGAIKELVRFFEEQDMFFEEQESLGKIYKDEDDYERWNYDF